MCMQFQQRPEEGSGALENGDADNGELLGTKPGSSARAASTLDY